MSTAAVDSLDSDVDSDDEHGMNQLGSPLIPDSGDDDIDDTGSMLSNPATVYVGSDIEDHIGSADAYAMATLAYDSDASDDHAMLPGH